jgi:hypothetical protein
VILTKKNLIAKRGIQENEIEVIYFDLVSNHHGAK